MVDNPASAAEENKPEPEETEQEFVLEENVEDVEAVYAAAQERDEDPNGDPSAQDLGAAEPPSDVDPEPQKNADADDDLGDVAPPQDA